MFFDLDAIYGEAQGDAFSLGKRKFYDNKVKNVSTAENDGKFSVVGSVCGERDYSVKITFDEQGGLYDYSCDCDEFSLEGGPCKHIVAVALSFEEKNPDFSPEERKKRKSDPAALSLIRDYGSRRGRKSITAPSTSAVELVPHLTLREDETSLRFTIGRKKQYILKDISDFVSACASNSYRRYGVDLELYHTPDSFTEGSSRLITFISRAYCEKAALGGGYFRYKDELRLLESDVDEFFSLCEGTLIHLSKTDLVLIAPFSEPFPIKLEVRKEEDGFSVGLDCADYTFISGKDYKYVLTGSRIFRLGLSEAETIKPFFDAIAVRGRLHVAAADMSAFYNSVLSRLSSVLDISADGIDLSVYEAAPLSVSAFISASEGELKLEPIAKYDETVVDLFSDFTRGSIVRDWDAENALRGVLAKYFPSYPELTLSAEADVFAFLTDGVRELLSHAEVFMDESMRKMRVRTSPRIHVGVRLSGGLLALDLSAEGYTEQELETILAAYREKKAYVRLGEGFVNLSDDSVRAISEIIEVGSYENGTVTMPRYYAPFVNDELQNGFFALSRDSAFKTLLAAFDGARQADVSIPESLAGVMRNYQKTGFRYLKALKDNGFGAVLADDMGLGKSLQIIALILKERARAIIICPTTLMLNWVDEFKKFAPSLKVAAVMSGQEERYAQIAASADTDVLITSYDLIRRDWERYSDIEFDYAVADEAQFIKNPETKNAVAVKRIRAKHRFALTGTPIENNLGELWSIFDFVMPGYLRSYGEFRDSYETEVVRGSSGATERLKKLVRPFILRRLKSDVLKELPQKSESVITVPMTDEQKRLYDANVALVRDSVRSRNDVSRVVMLSMITKLRQICCDPSLVYPEYQGNSAKTDSAVELIETAAEAGHKILLFSQFTSMLDIIRKKLIERGISHYLLRGDTPKAERLKLVKKFNENDVKVFLISLKAGGTGINLTGADVVIHYDPWWNESVMNQATDRAYRMGQTKSVQVYKLVMDGSIESRIIELAEKKTELSTRVVGRNNSLKEIIELLS